MKHTHIHIATEVRFSWFSWLSNQANPHLPRKAKCGHSHTYKAVTASLRAFVARALHTSCKVRKHQHQHQKQK